MGEKCNLRLFDIQQQRKMEIHCENECKRQDLPKQAFLSEAQAQQMPIDEMAGEDEGEKEMDSKLNQRSKKYGFMAKSDVLVFVGLYRKHMSQWSKYCFTMGNRKEVQLKNFFRNSLRNLSSKLNNVQRRKKDFQRNLIEPTSLHLLVDIMLKIRNVLHKMPSDYMSLPIFETGELILYHAFECEEAENEELLTICRFIRKLKKLIKNLSYLRKHIADESHMMKMAETIYNMEHNIKIVKDNSKYESRYIKEEKLIREQRTELENCSVDQQITRALTKSQDYQNPVQVNQATEKQAPKQEDQNFLKSSKNFPSSFMPYKPEPESAVENGYYDSMMVAHINALNMMMHQHYHDYLAYNMQKYNAGFPFPIWSDPYRNRF